MQVGRVFNVLFLCTGNSARSIIAEATLNELGKGRFRAYSAGSHPSGKINPLVLEFLHDEGLRTDGARSKSWDEFAKPGAPAMDFVITVCDDAAEACPVFPNAAERRHWSFPDPSAVLGDAEQRFAAFASVRDAIRDRIEHELIAEDVITGAG